MNTDLTSALITPESTGLLNQKAPSRPPVPRSPVSTDERRAVAALTVLEVREFRNCRSAWAFFNAQKSDYQTTVLAWVRSARQAPTRAIRLTALINASGNSERVSIPTDTHRPSVRANAGL